MKPFKCMTATKCDNIHNLKYPVYVSKKLDGIRATFQVGKGLLSRSGKPIRNKYISSQVAEYFADVSPGIILDGELMAYPEGESPGKDGIPTFQQCSSAVMSAKGKPGFVFFLFDAYHEASPEMSYFSRLYMLKAYPEFPETAVLEQILCDTPTEVITLEEQFLARGYEGAMVRSPDGPYKFGRSTLKQAYLLKLKRFKHDEARVVSLEEEMHDPRACEMVALEKKVHNQEATPEDTFRLYELQTMSDVGSQKVPKGTMGALVVENEQWGQFRIGTGFTAQQRADIWNNPHLYLGKLVRFSYFPKGIKDKPRHPSFDGWRHEEDL